MSTSDEHDVDAQEIPLDQLGEIAGGADTPEHRQQLEQEKRNKERSRKGSNPSRPRPS